jgi:uncharacterized LabA/DUF88 family protein
MDETGPRIALLIDADNASATRIDVILGELAGLGETNIRRAYGDWTSSNLKSWADILHVKAIRPVHQPAYTKRKNASDIALAVDAIDLLHTDRPDAFAIVSSDVDFTPLVTVLRQRAVAVYGFGESKTPEPFIRACSRFLDVAKLGSVETSRPGTSGGSARLEMSTEELQRDTELVGLLTSAISGTLDEGGWASVGWLGYRINNQSSFDTRNYGYSGMGRLLKAIDLFEFRDEGTGSVAVRLRS